MPISVLADCRHKLGRAWEHCELIDREIGDFFKANPYSVTTNYDGKESKYRFSIKPTGSIIPAVRWGLILGDCIHNARTALDYLIWTLAGSHLDQWVTFPICLRPNDFNSICGQWRSKRNRKPITIHPDAIAQLAAVQPYQSQHGADPKRDLLWFLQELDGRDKHKLLTAILGSYGGSSFSIFHPVRLDGSIDFEMPGISDSVEALPSRLE